MTRIDFTQVDALDAILSRLQDALVLTDRQVYPVARAQDMPSLPPGGDFWLTVAPGPGSFETGEQVPAMAATKWEPARPGNCTEESDVIVTIYTRIKIDSASHDRGLLMDDARGLLAIKKRVLGALVGQDLADAEGHTFLRQYLHAKQATAPDLVSRGDSLLCGHLAITFGVVFDWAI